MTTIMATYGRTLCWTKRNTTPNTGRVFAVGKLTDHGHYRRGGIRRYALVGSCLPDLNVYNLCCSLWAAPLFIYHYGNVRTHTLLDEKEHDPEQRKGVCCRAS